MHISRQSKERIIKDIPNILIFTTMMVVLIYNFSGGINGNDFWWHVKVGEWIIENRKVPISDIFSWYGIAQNFGWTAHEWMSEVVFYLIHNQFGDAGIFIFAILLAGVLLVLMWKQTLKYVKENLLISGIFYILFAVVASLFFYGRPHVFSFFFLYYTLKSLYDFYDNHTSKKIYYIPIIAVLWSNFHGGSSNLVYILCIIFWCTGMFSIKVGCLYNERKDTEWLLKLGIITLLSIGAIFINPAGIKMLWYPYENMSDKLMVSIISEWQAPDAKSIGQMLLYFVPIGLLGMGFVLENKRIRFIDGIIMATFLLLFFRSVRFILLWYIAAGFCAFSYMPKYEVKEITTKFEKIVCGIAVFLILVVFGFSVKTMTSTIQNGEVITRLLSDEIISVVITDNPEHLFNDYNLGEDLIYKDIPVFFDARADLYSANKILAEGCSLLLLQQLDENVDYDYINVQTIIEKYKFDALLILKSRPLYTYLLMCPEQFELIKSDDVAAYFKVKYD